MSRHLLIIYPHWPPSNLAGMHRARLVANGARESGWEVTVITVHPDHHEEPPDPEMTRLIRPGIEVIHTTARPVWKMMGRRLIGDIGLRAFQSMKAAATDWLQNNSTDFIWMPIPSWYTPLMGPALARKFNTPYGVDYIDPWVYQLTDHEPPLSRAWWTRQAALVLEPRAIRSASIISGVAEAYFEPALNRCFPPGNRPVSVAFPYGFDREDHRLEPASPTYPFDPEKGRYILYAGAFLPHSESIARCLFRAIASLKRNGLWPQDLRMRFVGTGLRPGPSISMLAEDEGIDDIVHEHPSRLPFLTVQSLLRRSHASLVLGSTEAHYTASKTFQCLLAGKPLMSILHKDSSALSFLQECKADSYSVNWTSHAQDLHTRIEHVLIALAQAEPDSWNPDLSPLEQHTATEGTKKLLKAIESLGT